MEPARKPQLNYEEEILARHSTLGLKRSQLTRQAKSLNMEFDENYRHMTKQDRDDFLSKMFPDG